MSAKIRFNLEPVTRREWAAVQKAKNISNIKDELSATIKSAIYDMKRINKIIQESKKDLDFEDLVFKFSPLMIESQFLWDYLIKVRNQRVKSKIMKQMKCKIIRKRSVR